MDARSGGSPANSNKSVVTSLLDYNGPEAAGAVWASSNKLTFEGVTADAYFREPCGEASYGQRNNQIARIQRLYGQCAGAQCHPRIRIDRSI